MSHNAICVTRNLPLRRALRRCLHAAGAHVEFVDEWDEIWTRSEPSVDLVVVDEVAARREGLSSRLPAVGGRTKVVLLGDPLDANALFELLRHEGCDHLIGHDREMDEDELVVTSVKLLRGDIFGMEKYLTWGVAVRERDVASYDEKREALREVTDYARDMGCRRQLIARVESVTDELLMNALYDAPAQRFGCRPLFQGKGRPGAGPVTEERARLRYACDAKHFVVAVRDNFGELRKSNILDHLARARAERGLPRVGGEEGGGGGLGLYFILNAVTRFIANIQPGRATEVICLFDLRAGAQEFHYRAKSLSIFVEPEELAAKTA